MNTIKRDKSGYDQIATNPNSPIKIDDSGKILGRQTEPGIHSVESNSASPNTDNSKGETKENPVGANPDVPAETDNFEKILQEVIEHKNEIVIKSVKSTSVSPNTDNSKGKEEKQIIDLYA